MSPSAHSLRARIASPTVVYLPLRSNLRAVPPLTYRVALSFPVFVLIFGVVVLLKCFLIKRACQNKLNKFRCYRRKWKESRGLNHVFRQKLASTCLVPSGLFIRTYCVMNRDHASNTQQLRIGRVYWTVFAKISRNIPT